MSDPKTEILSAIADVTVDAVSGNYIGAFEQAKKLAALIEVYAVPPIEAPSLDPKDRAAVDAEVDKEISG